jgi:hypothetical protein
MIGFSIQFTVVVDCFRMYIRTQEAVEVKIHFLEAIVFGFLISKLVSFWRQTSRPLGRICLNMSRVQRQFYFLDQRGV